MTGPGPAETGSAREADRRLVQDVIDGVVTPSTHRWVFEEDALLFAVRRLESDDPDWLLAALADASFPFATRALVFADTRDVRAEALAVLRAERPGFVPGVSDG